MLVACQSVTADGVVSNRDVVEWRRSRHCPVIFGHSWPAMAICAVPYTLDGTRYSAEQMLTWISLLAFDLEFKKVP